MRVSARHDSKNSSPDQHLTSSGAYTSLAQQSTGVGCVALDQLYRQMGASLQPQANVATNVLHDVINASDTQIAKPEITSWRSTVAGLIDTARQHYHWAKNLHAQALRDCSAAVDDKLRQCDAVEASGELPFMPTEDDNNGPSEPHKNAGEAASSAGYREDNVQDELDNNEEETIAAPNASDARPEASYPTLVAQCFTDTLRRNRHLNHIYEFVGEHRSDSQEDPIRRVLSTSENESHVSLFVLRGLVEAADSATLADGVHVFTVVDVFVISPFNPSPLSPPGFITTAPFALHSARQVERPRANDAEPFDV
ncbi:hypothetical protein DOTSEDRAFT_83832 [Dothistroma septosporum NZE10]|uniref:Uncharacterized protein n=1 Tax=Dothistroma septosporum (strain NZE10 / CBS 128990) TaxID=675120 RepID=N1PDC2_DOTSN|nr:hypothetical protein DOTSEDRAFT_83832 [Dothistroma septosporum NZE10]